MKLIVLSILLHQSLGLYVGRRQFLRAPILLMNMEEKFCKDCKFFKKDFFTETKYGHCSKFPNQPIDSYLVDGYKDNSPANYHYCSTARSSERLCGQEGKYFEAKT